MTDAIVKFALRVAAGERMRKGNYGISPCPIEPRINRRHIDGPYLSSLDGRIQWLTPWERLMTKLGRWDAWDIEWRHFPLPASAIPSRRADDAEGAQREPRGSAVAKPDAQTPSPSSRERK